MTIPLRPSVADLHGLPATEDCWQAWCDGTAAPNPGKLSAGVVIISPDGHRQEFSNALGCHGCNNEAELRTLSLTLDLAQLAGADKLHLFSDSRFVVDCVNGLESTEIPRLALLLGQIGEQLVRFKRVELRWLPRHRNTLADRLARAALGLPEKLPEVRKRRR